MVKKSLLAINWETGVTETSPPGLIFLHERKGRNKEREDEICVKKKRKERKSFFFFSQYVRYTVFYLFVLHCYHQEVSILKEENTAPMK